MEVLCMSGMKEKFVSKRVFAKMARKSIYTIDKLIEQKKILVEKDGTIDAGYLDLFIRESILESSKRGWLYLYPMSVQDFIRCEKIVRPDDDKMLEVKGVPSLINLINDRQRDSVASIQSEIMYGFRENVLKAFISRYSAAVTRQISSLVTLIESDAEQEYAKQIANISLGVLAQYVKYNDKSALPEDFDSTVLDRVHKGDSSDMRNKGLNANFEDIMTKLELVDSESGDFLFAREDLTPEFFKGKGDLYTSLVKAGVSLSGLKWGATLSTKDTKEIYEVTEKQYGSLNKRMAQADLLKNGFFVIAPAGLDLKRAEPEYTTSLTRDINEGYFSKVFIIGDENSWNNTGSESVANALDGARKKFNIEIEYVNPLDYKKEVSPDK